MRKGFRIALLIVVPILVCTITAWLGTQFYRPDYSVEIISQNDDASSDEDPVAAVSPSDIALGDNIAAYASSEGLYIVNEKTGEEKQITTEPASSVLFVDQTIYFVRAFHQETDEEGEPVWTKAKICTYDLSSGQVNDLFETKSYFKDASIVFANSNCLYYSDLSEKIPSETARIINLYRYSFESGEKELLVQHILTPKIIGDLIFYVALEEAIDRHPDVTDIGDLHLYNTETEEDRLIDKDSEILLMQGHRLVYTKIVSEVPSEGLANGNAWNDGFVNCCDLDGKNMKTLKRFDSVWSSVIDRYLIFYTETSDEIYNVVTDETVTVPNDENGNTRYYYGVNQGRLLAFSEKEYGKVYDISKPGEERLIVDITEKGLSSGWYYLTDWFDENGIFCSYSDCYSVYGYQFFPFEKGQCLAD